MKSLTVLAAVGSAAVLAILLFAGPIKALVIDARWIMYSIFIGLTLGGIPILKKLLKDLDSTLWLFVFAGVLIMVAISLFQSGGSGASTEAAGWMLMLVAGAAGASAMILPGISGGYLLLLMGAYIPILHGIDQLKTGLRTSDFSVIFSVLQSVVLPVGIGIVIGVVVVSHALKWLLVRYQRQTYAVLLGLLVGAIFGLWPFQQTVPLDSVSLIKAQNVHVVGAELVYTESGKPVKIKDVPVQPYVPGPFEAVAALALISLGFGVTHLVSKFGREETLTDTVGN